MSELTEIRDHLAHFAPFDSLPEELLDRVVDSIEVSYHRAGQQITALGSESHALRYIRSGSVEVRRRGGALYNVLGEGDVFGQFGLLRGGKVRFPARALEDTLIYAIPAEVFHLLCDQDEAFAEFVEVDRPRLGSGTEQQRGASAMAVAPVMTLVHNPPVMVPAGATVQEAARRLSESKTTAVLVLDDPGEDPARYAFEDADGRQWRVRGILTDSDFRGKVVAAGLPPDTPVGEVTGEHMFAIRSDESVQEAMLSMLRNRIRHLPVMQHRTPVGMIHLSDIVRHETNSSLYLANRIHNSSTPDELAGLAPDVRATFLRMVDDGADSPAVGAVLTAIGRSFTRRLLEMAQDDLGEPPVPYCFMNVGSAARDEQSIVTDQDNALVLSDSYDPALHGEYFRELAHRVSDGLATCGYPHCKGGIMATNTRWRQPIHVWERYFRDWITHPSPERLLHSSIFFDMDAVHGEGEFVERLQDLVSGMAPDHPLFLAAMARNAVARTPPLGVFRTFVVEKDGRQRESFNIKSRGTAPMVDLIRVHALASGSRERNSFTRLDEIERTQLLGPGVATRLRDALEVMAIVRIRHHVIDLKEGRDPDNRIAPNNVTDTERHNLKDAFQALSNAQKFLKFRYPMPATRP
ncbi:MAG: cyclic nucleotide-binding/CBS domain-containing protein [Actinobacteria bacterium]|nr:cyclic nucleotide-binding/CBS domain-containing protein [Actinomycetota bacterium]